MRGVPITSSLGLPHWPMPDALLGVRGWSRAPNIVQRIHLRGLRPAPGQSFTFSGSASGEEDYRIAGALMFELFDGSERRDAAFIGWLDDMRLGEQRVRPLGRAMVRFAPSDNELAGVIAASSRIDRVTLTALDYGMQFNMSDIHLIVRGPGADRAIARATIDRELPPGWMP